jgi:diacylglycerol O-acyltransferase / wax synthase
MKRLAGTDALFLSLETPNWHQHVGGLTVIDPQGGTITYEDIVANLADRIRYAPKFTWKLKTMPLGFDRPIWVDDPEFDVRWHVRRIAVPSPGGAKEIGEVAGSIMSTQLDRRRPLWELWHIEGLAGGMIAILMKYHHCLLDGVAGASLATALLDLEPDATAPMVSLPSPEESHAGTAPSDLNLLAHSVLNEFRRPVQVAKYMTAMAGRGVTALNRIRTDEENRAILRAPTTPFNATIGPRRNLAFASVAMEDVLALKTVHDVKVNDVLLAVTADALRRYLIMHDALPEAPLVTAVPVSTRSEGDASMDNQITNMFVSLATDIDDPIERLQAIKRSTQSAKAMTKAIGAREIQSLGEVASPLVLSTAIRAVYSTQLMSRAPVQINTLVSNVPGPPVPLYMCGGKVVAVFPSSVILEGMGLNVTIFSYMDRFDFGVQVDPDLVPDVWIIAEQVAASLAALMEASGLGAPTPIDVPFAEPPADEGSVGGAASPPEGASSSASKPRTRAAKNGSGGPEAKPVSPRKPRAKATVPA